MDRTDRKEEPANDASSANTPAALEAWLARADSLLESADGGLIAQSRDTARQVMQFVGPQEKNTLPFAELGLKARRTYVDALGRLVFHGHCRPEERAGLIGQATDAVESGLELARDWMQRDDQTLRPIALRLFRFGGHIYRRTQPQFLAEFVLENVGPATLFGADAEFVNIAREELTWARQIIDYTRATSGRKLTSEEVQRASELEAALKVLSCR